MAAYRTADVARLLNPLNVAEAEAAFLAGSAQPPFCYGDARPLAEAAAHLDGLPVPMWHGLGPLVRASIRSFTAMSTALQRRDAESFEAWAAHEGWEAEDAAPRQPAPEPGDERPVRPDPAQRREPASPAGTPPAPEPFIGPSVMVQVLQSAMADRGLVDWSITEDPVMSARVLVDASRREVRVNPRARFRASDADRLVAHEVDVHVCRATMGRRQPLRLFEVGLPGSLQTEEGLALLAETRATGQAPATAHQATVRSAIHLARCVDFRTLWESLRGDYGTRGAFNLALRVKRGLRDPGQPGVYAKDAVYGLGREAVAGWLDAGGPVEHLYVGKVGHRDPVREWLEDGLIVAGEVPRLWAAPGLSRPGPGCSSPETPP